MVLCHAPGQNVKTPAFCPTTLRVVVLNSNQILGLHNLIVGVASLQGAFGRAALGITSLVTYIGLGLGVLGSGLALPFGLYILIVQRSPEAVLQDSVTAPSSSRQVRTGGTLWCLCFLGPMVFESAPAACFGVHAFCGLSGPASDARRVHGHCLAGRRAAWGHGAGRCCRSAMLQCCAV